MDLGGQRGRVHGVAALADRLADQRLHRGERLGGLGGPAPLACGRGVGDGLQFPQRVRAAQLVIRGGVGVIRRPGVVDGDPGERGKHAHRLHRLRAAPGVDHEQGVLAGAGAVHPVQPAVHPEPGLVEPGHLAGGDLLAGVLQEPAQPPGGAGGEPADRPGRQRDAEQLGQRLRGALLGQELPDVQVDDDRGDPRPVLHRRLRARRGRALGAVPAAAFPLDQLMLGHLDRDRRQVEDLAALHPGDRPARQPGPAPAAAARLMPHLPVRPGHLRQRRALMPVLPAGLAAALLPQRPRPRRRLGQPLTGRRPGGIPRRLPQPRLKLSDPLPGRASSSSARASAACDCASSPRSETTSAASTSSPGPADHQAHPDITTAQDHLPLQPHFAREARRHGGVTCGQPPQAQLVICGPVEGVPVLSRNVPGTIRA